MTPTYMISAIVTLSLINLSLRSSSFLVPKRWLQHQAAGFFGVLLPGAIMTCLVVFCFKDAMRDPQKVVPFLLAGSVVAVIHLGTRKVLLSIGLGTMTYMGLLRYLP